MIITVTDSYDPLLSWSQPISLEAANQLQERINESAPRSIVGGPALFYPVRTNNCKNFIKDFFLPTVFNHAWEVTNIVLKILAILAALILDVPTFIVRVFTAIPRACSNAKRISPLKEFLEAQHAPSQLVEADHVRLRWENRYLGESGKSRTASREWNVNLIEVPTYEGEDRVASCIESERTA